MKKKKKSKEQKRQKEEEEIADKQGKKIDEEGMNRNNQYN